MIVSEIRYNEVSDRIDAEFYLPEYLKTEKLVTKFESFRALKELSNSIQYGTTPEGAFFPKEGIPFIRSQDFSIYGFNFDRIVNCTKEFHCKHLRSKVVPNDILIAAVGATIGQIGLVPPEIKEGNINQNIARVRLKDSSLSYFCAVFLSTKFGRNQLLRLMTRTAQGYLNTEQIKSILISIPPSSFQQKIELLVKESYQKRKEADGKYKEAEILLNKTLGIEKLELKDEKIFETRFDEVESGRRFDTDYYLPKFTEIFNILKNSKFKLKKLKELHKEEIRRINPLEKPSDKFVYVEIGDVDISTGEIESKNILGHEAPPNARRVLKAGDIVISMVRPTRGAITIIPDELDNSLGSTAFYILNLLSPFREFLLLFLKSPLGLNQLGRPVVGAMYPTLKKEYVENIIIPMIPEENQKLISNLVKQSFVLRKEAKELLERAKKEVEEFIEKNNNHNRH